MPGLPVCTVAVDQVVPLLDDAATRTDSEVVASVHAAYTCPVPSVAMSGAQVKLPEATVLNWMFGPNEEPSLVDFAKNIWWGEVESRQSGKMASPAPASSTATRAVCEAPEPTSQSSTRTLGFHVVPPSRDRASQMSWFPFRLSW